jgi:hypothetical protein
MLLFLLNMSFLSKKFFFCSFNKDVINGAIVFLSLYLISLNSFAIQQRINIAPRTSPPQCFGQPINEDNIVVIQIAIPELILSDAIVAYVSSAGQLFLPFGEINRMLEFPITEHPTDNKFKGWFYDEKTTFELDKQRCIVHISDSETKTIEPNLVYADDFEYFISADYLKSWFQIDVEFSPLNSYLQLKPARKLPFIERLERETSNQRIHKNKISDELTYYIEPYQFASWPILHIKAGVNQQKSFGQPHKTDTIATFDSTAMFDFLYMNTKLRLNGNQDDWLQSIRMTSERIDLDGGLLGQLAATQVSIGDIFTRSSEMLNNSQAGRGVNLSNLPLTRPQQFDKTDLQGDLLPGWQVELYRNGALVDFQQAAENGRYHFRDVALHYGRNELLLKFYGTYGEVVEELEVLDIGSSLIAKDQSYYQFSVVDTSRSLFDQVEKEGASPQLRSQFSYEYGLDTGVSWMAGFDSFMIQASEEPAERHTYFDSGLRFTKFDSFFQLNYVQDFNGGNAWKASIQRGDSRNSLFAEHIHYQSFVTNSSSQERLASKSTVRLNSDLSFESMGNISMILDASLTKTESDKNTFRLSNDLSTKVGDFHLAHKLKYSKTSNDRESAPLSGAMLLNTYLYSHKYRLRGELSYDVKGGTKLNTLSTQFDAHFDSEMSLKLSVKKNMIEDKTEYSSALDMKFKDIRIGFSADYNRDTRLNLGVNISGNFGLIRNPYSKSWSLDSALSENSGAIASQVYFDDNTNGVFDDADNGLEHIGLTGQINTIKTDKRGVSHVIVPAYSKRNVAVDIGTLDDPSYYSTKEVVNVVVRPGVITQLDFPVVITGEIDGTVTQKRGGKVKALSGVTLSLNDLDGNIIQQVKSSYDGFYLFYNVPPGQYRITFLEDELNLLNAEAIQSDLLDITSEGNILAGNDLELVVAS